MRVAIIGAGLAGTACAYALKKAGAEPVIYEAGPELAHGASGNMLGLYNPRFTAEKTRQSEYYARAFHLALEVFESFEAIDFNPCGALHLMTDEKKEIRYRKMLENWGWPEEQMRIVSAQEASAIAGVPLDRDALYLPQSGYVSPKKLCAAYTQGVETYLNMKIEMLDDLEADAVILACSSAAKDFDIGGNLPIKPVRGQVTHVQMTPASSALNCCICYGGYVTPAFDGAHMVGSTFQRWLDHTEPLPEDDRDNLDKLEAVLPGLTGEMKINGQRAALRCSAPDHFPIVGRVQGNIYVSTAHASHGLLSSLMAAHILSHMILSEALPVSEETVMVLDPGRFS